MERSPARLVEWLAVLKAGGGDVPSTQATPENKKALALLTVLDSNRLPAFI